MAHSHMDGSSSNSTGMMVPWLHFTPGDTLLFENWVPTTPGVIFGACVGLFTLGMIDRWLAAIRRLMEVWWTQRAHEAVSRRFVQIRDRTGSEEGKAEGDVSQTSLRTREPPATAKPSMDWIPPFIASHDFVRGAFVVFQTAIMYALMLVVMTFNAGFILAVLLGLGTGEVLFGRVGYAVANMPQHVGH